jgi:hypothetical protein
MSTDNLNSLRELLFDTLRNVKAGTMDLDRARGVNEIAKTLVDTARVEVDFVRATDGSDSTFIVGPTDVTPALPGQTGHTTVHRLRG